MIDKLFFDGVARNALKPLNECWDYAQYSINDLNFEARQQFEVEYLDACAKIRETVRTFCASWNTLADKTNSQIAAKTESKS